MAVKFQKTLFALLALAGLLGAASAQTQQPGLKSGAEHAHHAAGDSAQSAALSEGEVKKVDKQTGKVTLKHGPLNNLGMPAMTMVFRVADPGMLDSVKAGDKVRFVADKVNGQLTVTQISTNN